MAKGNAQRLTDLIDDTVKSKNTTFSSEHIQDLINESGAEETVYLLTVSNTRPDSFTEGDKYYSSNTKLIYTALDNTKFDNGENPKKNILYLDKTHTSILVWDGTRMTSYGGSTSTDIKISSKDNNAIKQLDGQDEGLFVEDLSEQVKQINIAQKTVNDLGINELLLQPFNFKADPSTVTGTGKVTRLDKSVTLLDDVSNYNYLDIYLKPNSNNRNRLAQCTRVKVSDIVYNNSNTENEGSGSTFAVIFSVDNAGTGTGGSVQQAVKCWFKDSKTLLLKNVIISVASPDWTEYSLSIQGIKKEVITIDPVNYIDTTQGIQDVPVGTLIEVLGEKDIPHYLLCDGTEYNIVDYRDLAEAIKKVYGSYNYFGGDGTNTFAVPKYVDTNKWFSPKQTSNSNPYNVSASSAYNSWQVWWGFNNSCTTSASNAWHSAVGSTTGHWVQIDFKAIKSLSGISMAPRPEGDYNVSRMPRDFDIMGSNDGTTWNVIKSYTGINDYENYKYREFIFDRPEKYRYYRIANIVITGDCVNIADIHFLEAPEKYVYIKYQPTYFIGSITGYEERKTLMDTPTLIPCTNGVLKPGTEILLSESLDNYDYVEVHTGVDYAGTPFGRHVTRIPVSEITYSPSKHEWMNTYQEWVCDQNSSFSLWYGFKDVQTLYVGRIQANYTEGGYRGYQIIKIVGIRNKYKVIETVK